MKLKYKMIVNEVAGKKVAVAVGDDIDKFSGFIKTNDVGAEIIKILENDVTIDEIVAILKSEYPHEAEAEIENIVKMFVEAFEKEQILE